MSERPESCSCEKIFKFWCRCRYATHDFVAADAGKHDAIPLGGEAHPELRGSATIVAGGRHKTAVWCFGRRLGLSLFFWVWWTDVDVPASAAAFFFHFAKVGAFIPVGFGVVVVGDGVEA